MLAAVYLQPSDAALLAGANVQGAPLVGTTADFVRHLGGEIALGRMFVPAIGAVAGANASDQLG